MAYTDDWESLMNGVFGAGGRVKFGSGAVQPDTKAKTGGLPDLNAALLEQQKQLDELLKKQNAQLKKQDADTQTALENSRQMLRDMENDGLLAKGTADTKPEHLGSFEGLATEVKKTVLGQDAFVDGVVRAMRRPFVLGTEAPVARNVILLSGAPGTGRHFALEETARIMAARGLLQSDKTAVLDLALYPDAGSEKLFLQDLYAALHAPGEILIFEHYESCYPGFLKTIADLATKSSAPLSSRYLVNKEGILVDAGTALAPGAVSRIDPCGKYLIFFSHKGREVLADKFGAPFVSAVGDVCTTTAFAREDLAAMAAQELNALAQKVRTRLGLTLTAGADVRDYVAAQCSKEKGAAGLKLCCDRIFRALSEYCLQTDTALTGTVALTAVPEGLQFALNGAAPADLFSLLPTEYTGAVDEIRAELDALVGLAPVKDYVFGLADNLQVQQRRAAAGFKTASLSMHMIFTGNPGTGKGNDQVRFELTIKAFAPDMEIIAPWRVWDIKSRDEEIDYAIAHQIPLKISRETNYSKDKNLWHLSHEGLDLENPANEPLYNKEGFLEMGVSPEAAPDKPTYITLDFEKGVPVALNGEKLAPVALLEALNRLGGENGIGLADIVENRLVGMKSRGVYETPGGTILYKAHKVLETLTLDRDTQHYKELVAAKFAELVYFGQWFTPLREALSAFVDKTQETVTGTVKLKLYKGNMINAGVTSPYSLYDEEIATFDEDQVYDQSDSAGFINLFGLPIKVKAMADAKREGKK